MSESEPGLKQLKAAHVGNHEWDSWRASHAPRSRRRSGRAAAQRCRYFQSRSCSMARSTIVGVTKSDVAS
jgi:hypothetical protein